MKKEDKDHIYALSLTSTLASRLIEKGILTREEWHEICKSASEITELKVFEREREELK